jgi:inner membrane protein
LDNLTHTLTGLALSRAGLAKATRGATLALALASNLPDVDLVFAVHGSASYLEHHRGFTHSLVGAPLLALALALALRLLVPGSRLPPLVACCLVGVTGHVFMDLWTSYGTRVLAPFDRHWLTWDLVFILDPWILAVLVAAIAWRRGTPQGPRVASVGLGLVLAYVGARAVLHAQAIEAAVSRLGGRPVERVAALPSPLNPFVWRVIADTGDAYWSGSLDLRGRSGPLLRRVKLAEDATVVRAREESPIASVFLDFSSFPWLEVQETADGTRVTWRDLRFEGTGRQSFAASVTLDRAGRLKSQEFHY